MLESTRPLHILHLEDSPRDALLIQDCLEQAGVAAHIELVEDRARFEDALVAREWHLILCDYNLPDYDGLAALQRVREKRPHTPVIMLSGSISPEEAVTCMRAGATDYLMKQERAERLAAAVQRAVDEAAERRLRIAAEALLREKEILLKEIHHRVKNNLQVIASLLRLEGRRIKEPAATRALDGMTARIHAMALLHEMLYRAETSGDVRLDLYLHGVVGSLLRIGSAPSRGATLAFLGEPVTVSIDQATPCGLIVQELASNCLRHARSKGPAVTITLEVAQAPGGGAIHVGLKDNGVGLPADFDDKRKKSLGLQLVTDLARQLGGQLEIASGTAGASFGLNFPKTPARAWRETVKTSSVADGAVQNAGPRPTPVPNNLEPAQQIAAG